MEKPIRFHIWQLEWITFSSFMGAKGFILMKQFLLTISISKRRYILLGYRMTAKFLKYLSNWGNKSYSGHRYARCFFVQSKFTWVGPEILYQLATRLSHCSLEGYDVQVEAGFYCDSHLQKN